MSYDLAVWQGARPSDDHAALQEFLRLSDDVVEAPMQPSPAVERFVATLLARYPDLDAGGRDGCPWAVAPLLDEAVGRFMHLALNRPVEAEVLEFVARTAADYGLVCFDPQAGRLLRGNGVQTSDKPGDQRQRVRSAPVSFKQISGMLVQAGYRRRGKPRDFLQSRDDLEAIVSLQVGLGGGGKGTYRFVLGLVSHSFLMAEGMLEGTPGDFEWIWSAQQEELGAPYFFSTEDAGLAFLRERGLPALESRFDPDWVWTYLLRSDDDSWPRWMNLGHHAERRGDVIQQKRAFDALARIRADSAQ